MRLTSYLFISSIMLIVSGFIDIVLWFTIKYHVPSFAIGCMSIAVAIIILALRKIIIQCCL